MPINVLIVDDSTNIRFFVKKTISMIDIEIGNIYEADNGESALKVLDNQQVDLVLTDINMPVMDGLEMTKKIRSQDKFGKMKIVVISTEGSKDMILETVKAGANGYIKKPFGPDEALDILQGVTENGNA